MIYYWRNLSETEFMSMSLIKREEFCSYPRTILAWKCMSADMLVSELISPIYLNCILSKYYKVYRDGLFIAFSGWDLWNLQDMSC